MITADLISYIRKQQDNNIPKNLILSNLESVGWHIEDIEEGFEKVEEIKSRENRLSAQNSKEENQEEEYQSLSIADRYREPIDLDAEPLAKTEIPTGVKKKEIEEPKKIEEPEIKTDAINLDFQTSVQDFINNQSSVETPKEEPVFFEKSEMLTEDAENIDSLSKEEVGLPLEEKPEKQIIEPFADFSIPEQKGDVVDNNPIVENLENSKIIIEEGKEPLVEPVLSAEALEEPEEKNRIWLPKNVPVKEIEAPGEEENDIVVQNVELPEKTLSQETASALLKEQDLKSFNLEGLPKIAPITTYPKDVLAVLSQIEKEKANSPAKKTINKRLIKWAVIILAIILVGGVATWAFMTNKINLKNINIPFINKDPRSLILNNSKILASLGSYKTETTLEISTPSFANISAGLLTGEAVSSLDKDNLILNSSATVIQKNGEMSSDNSIVVRGSILQETINAKIQKDGQYLYLNFPNLSSVLKETAPLFGSVKIREQEFYLVPSLFGTKTEKVLSKINLYKLLSGGVSSYIDQDTLGGYDDLIKKVKITKKGEESIKGVTTYHYSISPDKELFKNLLTKIIERYSGGLNDADKENANLLISSARVSSFDVWVGKGDNTIYQYNIVLEIPMTKILGFEDKSVGNNTMGVSFKVTYFDFNNKEEIILPDNYMGIEEFVKNTKIDSLKNKMKEFTVLANNLKKIEKKFGVSSNSKGSCMSPVSGSLFSPLGHSKTAVLPVSEISSFLNYILGLTKGMGSCYSDTKDWSFAIPLSDNYETIATSETFNTFYCIDSKGADIEISIPPNGVTCEQKIETKPQI